MSIEQSQSSETSEKLISFRGSQVVESWPKKLKDAQSHKSMDIEGERFIRIPWGEETAEIEEAKRQWTEYYHGHKSLVDNEMRLVKQAIEEKRNKPCSHCRAERGEYHVYLCEMEECPKCHRQALACSCKKELVK